MGSVTETINDDISDLHEKDKDATSGNAFMDGLCEATADVLRKRIQDIREDVSEYVNNRINDMMSEILQKIEIFSAKNGELYSTDKYHDKREFNKKDVLPDKKFLKRNSLLTDLFEISHIRAIYNMFAMTFILLLLNTVATDIMESGTTSVGTNILRIGFAKFPMCICIWSFMQTSTLGVYVVFTFWAYQRLRFSPKSSIRKLWDYSWLSAFITYQILFVILSTKAVLDANLSIGCNFIAIVEQIRMMMKSYAFVRSTAPRFFSYKPHSETQEPDSLKFSQYLYFLFAPTLVYRDEYPRTKRIIWMVVIRNFVEFGLSIFYLVFIVENFLLPICYEIDTQHLEWKWFVKNIVKSCITGIFCLLTLNYLLFHTWMNAWAEMLQFADRLFYKDWWNSTNYPMFYRMWNVVVHDWLYTYIYKDMYEIVLPRNRMLSATIVFIISAIVHEYILVFTFGFVYPVQFSLFIFIGVPMYFVRKIVINNVFMWVKWSIGMSIIICLYPIEYYARQNCLPHSNYYLDLFIPRSWSCRLQFN